MTKGMLEACEFHPDVGIRVLIQKALITVSRDGYFDMHDLVQEMGHYIVQGEHRDSPEEHSRLWQTQIIDDLCFRDEIKPNNKVRAIWYNGASSCFPKLVSNMKKLRLLMVYRNVAAFSKGPKFLSNELRYLHWPYYPANLFPENFRPANLAGLNFHHSLQKELWNGSKVLPRLKTLKLDYLSNLVRIPEINEFSSLEELSIICCESLEDIHPSLGNLAFLVKLRICDCSKLRMLPPMNRMKKLETLTIDDCHMLCEFPEIQTNKSLPHLKRIMLRNLKNLVRAPDFDRIPCLEELSIENCNSLEEIHPSLGNHKSLVEVSLVYCKKLRMFPTNIRMEKLETLWVYDCPVLRKFPEKQASMDRLPWVVSKGHDVSPSLIGEGCTRLTSLTLSSCQNLEIGHLQMLNSSATCFQNIGLHHMGFCLKKLDISFLGFEDGEIPSEIGELFSLQVLDLHGNDFSRLHFSLSQLTRLKHLILSLCVNLVELPHLPSNIAVLIAEECNRLASVGDGHMNCKRLSRVSLWGSPVKDAHRLLRSMLQGSVVEKHSMTLLVHGIEILENFKPLLSDFDICRQKRARKFKPLISGGRCALTLPSSWYNDYSGFLLCCVFSDYPLTLKFKITMEHGICLPGVSEDYFDEDNALTWVGCVSFASLKHTAWWDSTSDLVSFSFALPSTSRCIGFGVRLVPRNRGNGLTEPSQATTKEYDDDDDDDDDDDRHKFNITHDSTSTLEIDFPLTDTGLREKKFKDNTVQNPLELELHHFYTPYKKLGRNTHIQSKIYYPQAGPS